MAALMRGKRPDIENEDVKAKIPPKIGELIRFCWIGGPTEHDSPVEERYTAQQALDFVKKS